jgi:hypothetical protein
MFNSAFIYKAKSVLHKTVPFSKLTASSTSLKAIDSLHMCTVILLLFFLSTLTTEPPPKANECTKGVLKFKEIPSISIYLFAVKGIPLFITEISVEVPPISTTMPF